MTFFVSCDGPESYTPSRSINDVFIFLSPFIYRCVEHFVMHRQAKR
jgi:hypothetical protein